MVSFIFSGACLFFFLFFISINLANPKEVYSLAVNLYPCVFHSFLLSVMEIASASSFWVLGSTKWSSSLLYCTAWGL